MGTLPRYPVYIPSKGRMDVCYTAQCLRKDGVPFTLVVEQQEAALYEAHFPNTPMAILPFRNQGLIAARNWIKAHATAAGHVRHWQIDDNIRVFKRRWQSRRVPCNAGVALAVAEDFVDRYENVAIAGLNYEMFLKTGLAATPFYLNCRVYSCTLVLNSIPHTWRSRYNDDTDICLQVLADGWCTVLLNAFLVQKCQTMKVKGGNTPIYQGDGRLKMARSLERLWPGVVKTNRRFTHAQHVVKDSWKRFDTPLRLKPGIEIPTEPNEYGMELVQVKPIKSAALRALVAEHGQGRHAE